MAETNGSRTSPKKKTSGNVAALTKMLKAPKPPPKYSPSMYLAEMSLTTSEKLSQTREMYPPRIIEFMDIGANATLKDSAVDADQALFQPFPSEIIFQQFERKKTYEFPLTFRNLDRVARLIKVTHKTSPYFSIMSTKPSGQKIAPGMEITYNISFTPDENKDYNHELICVTEREKFTVPIKAIGARAVLDFPDEIYFNTAPVKYCTTKTILVRNVGKKGSKIELETSKPFSVSPMKFTLESNSCIQVEVGFSPQRIEDQSQELSILYDTGEKVYVPLHGTAVNVNVRLDKNSLLMDNTYIGLCSQRMVTLSNRADVAVHFEWKSVASEEEEQLQKEMFTQQVTDEETSSKDAFLERCLHNPSIRDRFPILSHSYENRKKLVYNEKFLYSSDVFDIDPVEGDIWPNSQAEITITFQPEKATSHSTVAYCDVTGRESRLPLKIKGEGIGPKLKFSFDTLDIQNVFVNSAHAYEVILVNNGDIEASYTIQPSSSLFGPKFSFNPSSGHLFPDGLQAIQISFSSSTLGKFDEDFIWQVEGSLEPLKLRILGTVIGPTFQFNVPEINFGTISYGFPVTHEVILTNTSEVPMTFDLRVPLEEKEKRTSSQEIIIKPQNGILPPNIQQGIKVIFTPRHVKNYFTFLIVDIKEVGNDVFSLPLKANSIVPAVVLSPMCLDYGRCFITHPYTMNIQLSNTHTLPAHYEMIKMPDNSPILCETTKPKGVVGPQQQLSIPLTIHTQTTGQLTVNCCFCIIGSSDPPQRVEIHCIGEGPVISVNPSHLDWGVCPVLTPVPKRLVLSNESEIEAEFEAILMRENSVFVIQPPSGVVPPRQKMEISVVAELDDSIRFTDKLTLVVMCGVSYTVPLCAEGKGTTIVSYPSLYPNVNLGTHFASQQCCSQFTLTNRGRRTQALSWTTEGFSMVKLKKAELKRASRDRRDVAKKSQKPEIDTLTRPMFQISPDKFILSSYESQTVVITGQSSNPQTINERLTCHSVIGRNPHKERIMTVDVSAHFIAPLLKFSHRELKFIIEQTPGSELLKHTKDLTISSVSPLPLTAVLSCSYPFSMILNSKKGQHFTLELQLSSDEEVSLTIMYDSTYCVDKNSRVENQRLEIAYKEHPQKDYVILQAEVYFPNLEFETNRIEFGSILNDTELVKFLKLTNTSPLPVEYTWSFLKRPPIQRTDPVNDDEGVDMQSECENDSLESSSVSLSEPTTNSEMMGGIIVNIVTPSPCERKELHEQEERSVEDKEMVYDDDDIERESVPVVPVVPYDLEGGMSTQFSHSLPLSEMSTENGSEHTKEEEEEGVTTPRQQPWEIVDNPFIPIGIEQVFDILPLYGTLQSGETQDIQITFYGHSDITTEVVAACKVHGGPTYQLILAGEASTIEYKIDKKNIKLGSVIYDSIYEEEVTLTNTGKVSMDFCVLGITMTTELSPGQVSVSPAMGQIQALESEILHIRFFPGIPQPFKKLIQIQVAHFEPDVISLVGEGSYPRLSLSLPRPILESSSSKLDEVKKRLTDKRKGKKKEWSLTELEQEVERMTIEQFVQENDLKYINNTKSTKLRPSLPEYLLDFGCVVSGLIASHHVTLTNIGSFPLSFTPAHSSLTDTGFSINLASKVKSLPGAPQYESIDFEVHFDPASVNCQLGHVEAVLPFQLQKGPIYQLKLEANVTLPTMEVSSTELQFGTVICGQCHIITIRLHNPLQVKCQWNAITDKPPKKIPKHTPLHIRKKIKEKPPPKYFELEPSSGILLPGQKIDVQVKFMPSEELLYTDKIPLVIHQNPQADLVLNVVGQGSEPQVVFDKNLIEFLPILPFSDASDGEVTVTNPMDYPVEIYSLEFDKQYSKEEEILRWVRGYDSQHRLFLPPTEVGGTLPHELIEAFEKDTAQDDDVTQDHDLTEVTEETSDEVIGSTMSIEHIGSQDILHPRVVGLRTPHPSSTALLPQRVEASSTLILSHATLGSGFSQSELQFENLESSPVAACIARYLGIDLSPEAALAERRKGIALILYGPQHSGKSVQAKCLAEIYNTPILNIQELIVDVVSSGSTPAGLKAREVCIEATNAAEIAAANLLTEPIETPSASKVTMSQPQQRRTSRVMGSTHKYLSKESEEETKKEPPKPFPVDCLLDTPYAAPKSTLLPTNIPEDIIVEILTDRLQQTDCRKGVIFDGLECQFTSDDLMTVTLVLKAINNRKHIYFINLEMDFMGVKDRIKQMEAEKERQIEEEEKIKQAEEDKIQALLDMNEDEYELLSSKEQKKIDDIRHQRYLEKRRRIQKEKEEKERLEQQKREEELRQQEEDKFKHKKGRAPKPHQDLVKPSPGHSRPDSAASIHLQQGSLGVINPTSITSNASINSNVDSVVGRRKSHRPPSMMKNEEDLDSEEEILRRKYDNYETCYNGIKSLLQDWDREKGLVRLKKPLQPVPEPEIVLAVPKKAKSRKSTSGRVESSPQQPLHPLQKHITALSTEGIEETEQSDEGLGVPLISVPSIKSVNEMTFTIRTSGLPSPEEILNSLGLNPEGPSIPEPVTFQVYPYPLKRRRTQVERFECISTGQDDQNAVVDDQISKESPDLTESHDTKGSPEPIGRIKHSGSVRSKEDLGTKKRSKSSAGKHGKSSPSHTPLPPQQQEETVSDEQVSEDKQSSSKKLAPSRWIIPAKGECKIKFRFKSHEEGQFDQTLNFEIVGTRRHYQLFCRGFCQFPTISKEPRVVFPHRKRTVKKGEIIQKRYILGIEEYQFGPLHCSKPRDRYREGRYPENMERITISNPGQMTSDVSFCFQKDVNASTFLYEPRSMTLQTGESQTLTIWAYPKSSGEVRDAMVCSVKHNPQPVTFPITCIGVEPELKVDKKMLDFGKVLLHRRETRVLHLRNNTFLAAAWKLSGIETLGDEFCFSQEQGIVQPKSEFPLNVHFRAVKPINYPKKAFKIEISDVEQIIGLMHVESVQIQAEAYDVALDISFPKGTDGGLDFGCLRAHEEMKLSIQLKNRGKYEMAYNFLFDVSPEGLDYSKWFVLNPTKNVLYAGEKSQTVSILFKPDREIHIRDEPILKCQVIDVHLGDHGEVIANIPVRFSAKAIFSKYSITPLNDVNFGCLVITSRKSNNFTIENKGEFEFRYSISKRLPLELQKLRQNMPLVQLSKRGKGDLSSASHSSSVSSKFGTSTRTKESLRYEVMGVTSQRLVLGLFSIAPATGVVAPGQSQSITVDCIAERQGKHEEPLSIEISDSNKRDMPLRYKVCAEVLVPGINSSDLSSIFDEHRICKQLGVLGEHQFHEDGCIGVYGESERKFMFKSVIVGHNSKARFRIINSNKIPCDINIATKSTLSKHKGTTEIFEVEPTKASIAAHSHVYATVSFKPAAMQVYNAVFEVTVEGPPQSKGKGLIFDLQGEGNLPQVSVIKPTTRSGSGQHLLLFKKLLLGQKETLPVVISNTGSIPAILMVDLSEEARGPFTLSYIMEERENVLTAFPMSLHLPVQSTKKLLVSFMPQSMEIYKGCLNLRVKDNQFETMAVSLVGEGYQSELVIQNVRGQRGDIETVDMVDEVIEGDIEAAKTNHLQYGSCPVGESSHLTYTLTNYSSTDPIRFQWPTVDSLTFSPALGHLHPCSSKDIVTTFTSNKPKSCKNQKFAGKFWKIAYSKPIKEIPEWDDRMKTVKWVNATSVKPDEKTGEVLPLKRKVIETEPEPEYNKIINEDEGEDINVFLSAVTTYAEYECPTSAISFKDTYILQTKVFRFPLRNTGQITLSYKWFMIESSQPEELDINTLGDDSKSSVTSSGVQSTSSGEYSNKEKKGEDDENRFVFIEPHEGEIPPGSEQIISVKFSPLDLIDFKYNFRCKIPNLHNSAKPLDLHVTGNSLLPYCHFDLLESDYISNRRPSDTKVGINLLNSRTAGGIDPATKVIEFSATGTGQNIIRSFNIINPTELNYEFQWSQDEGQNPSSFTPPVFTCHTPKGLITGGKRYEIVFEYTPTAQQLTESIWHFSIPSLSLSVPFLLVGHTLEPNVNLDRAYLNFRSMLVGTSNKDIVYLINNEDKPYQFKFSDKSCLSDTPNAKLTVSPMNGTIAPHSKFPVEVSLTAVQEREFIFHLRCNIKRKPTPLTLNVKAVGHSINIGLSTTDSNGVETMLPLDKGPKRIIDFGKVPVNERALWELSIHNYNQFDLHYEVETSEGCNKKGGAENTLVSIRPMEGIVKAHDKSNNELVFSPITRGALKNCDLLLKIINGPSISISLKGAGTEPQVSFSFLEYDFGPRFLHHPNMPPNITTLVITNREKTELNIDCLYSSTPYMELHFESRLLVPGETIDIDCYFRPHEAMKYKEVIVFEVNGIHRKAVTIKGEGALMKVDLVNPSQKFINFGALRVGQKSKRKAKLINRSLLSVTFTVNIVPSAQVPALHQDGVLGVALCPAKGQTIGQMGNIMLKPNSEIEVEVSFSPPSRVPQFSEEVIMETHGLSHPLFVVKGSCHGLEIGLDSSHVPFGAVVLNSQSIRRILMINSGDIGARFCWDIKKFEPDFSISPVEGYISTGMEIPFDVTFHPQGVNHDIHYDNISCQIEGGSPVTITLTGVCIEQPPMRDAVQFTTTVRNKETRQITVHNKSSVQWLLHPIIDGEYWTGPVSINIAPGQTCHYGLTYHPLVMTLDSQKHQGSIFFPLPDGTGILYNLFGTSDPPKHSGSIAQEIPCKTSHTELLTVQNWLRYPQRFRAFVEMTRPEKLDRSVTLYGMDYIDVPAMSKRDYKLKFYSFKEGSFLAKVTFQNEQTGEYQFFHVHFKSVPAGIINTIELTTAVRRSISHTIAIDNPFPSPINMTTTVNHQEITIPTSFLIGPESQGKCTFEFLPLKVGEIVSKLTLQSSELGSYHYELQLKATPAAPERPIHFTTTLGSSQTLPCYFTSYAKGRTEYTCKVDSSEFHVEKSITAAAMEASVDVNFEPSSLGDTRATLTISSPTGGDYSIPLQGHCLEPRPQGPYTIKAGNSITIPFRNIFHQTKPFSFTVDNPVFTVKAGDNLKPRKVYNILVQFDKQTDSTGSAKLGKLVVSCPQSGKNTNGVQWTYYLKGLPPESK